MDVRGRNFDPENPAIFERMGSAYYLAGQPKKAIDAWKRALYLDPTKTELKAIIENAKEEEKRQKQAVEEYFAFRKKVKNVEEGELGVEMQVLRIVQDSNKAYSYAQEVRQQMKGIKVEVEELDNGKWAVKIPRPKQKKEKK